MVIPPSAMVEKFLRLSMAEDIGPIVAKNLIDHFGSIDQVLGASPQALARAEGVGPKRAEGIRRAVRDDEAVERELGLAAEQGVRILCPLDGDYPLLLQRIHDPPLVLYLRGELLERDRLAIAVVGSRQCSTYGCEQAKRFGYALGQAGFTVISGMARGIDAFAHIGALDAGGRTVAVLGNGLSQIYPRENKPLHDRICDSGAVVSELQMRFEPEAKNFLPRNRIIAGMALGTVVVEAGQRSGSLSTANLTLQYNRELFAVPGRVDSNVSTGTNKLIQEGAAKLVMDLGDILDELGAVRDSVNAHVAELNGAAADEPPGQSPVGGNLSGEERLVLEALSIDGVRIDAIIEATGLSPGKTTATLTGLQLKSLIKQFPGNVFAKVVR
jgi:DNA processing protein